MKKMLTVVTAVLLAVGLQAQAYMLDIGGVTTNERVTDAIVIGAPGSQISLIAGITNTNGFDQFTITSVTNGYAGINYQKKYFISVSTGKEYAVVNSVKIAYDNTSGSANFNVGGAYTRTSTNGSTIFGYGLFSATINIATGNIVSLKRWESSVTGVGNMYVASVCARGTDFFITGNIRYNAFTQNRMFVYALDGSNNQLWNKVDYASSHTNDFNIADIIYSPYQPTSVPELVIVGVTRPNGPTVPTDLFVRRLNATTGAVIAQNTFSTGVAGFHEITNVIPSLSSSGVYDGFLICGTHEDQTTLINCGWITKVNTTATTVTWSKYYRYMNNSNYFLGSDLAQAPASIAEPNSFYFSGTAINGVSGPTYDEATFKINSSGGVIWLTSATPVTNKNESTKVTCAVQNSYTGGFCTYGTRNLSGPTDMYAIMWADWSLGNTFYCGNSTVTTYSTGDVSLSVLSFGTTDYATLNSGTISQNNTTLNHVTELCYDDFDGGVRLAGPTVVETHDSFEQSFSVAPNPATGLFVLTKTTDAPVNVSVVDITGREVYSVRQMNDKTIMLDLTEQPAGMYLVHIVSDTKSAFIRIVKQ